MFANPVFITPGIHSFSKRLTVQKKIYIYLLFLWEKQKKKTKDYTIIYISEMRNLFENKCINIYI